MTDLLDPVHRPTGPWWKRFLEACRVAIENINARRLEGGDDGVHLLDDLEDLAEKDDRKGRNV